MLPAHRLLMESKLGQRLWWIWQELSLIMKRGADLTKHWFLKVGLNLEIWQQHWRWVTRTTTWHCKTTSTPVETPNGSSSASPTRKASMSYVSVCWICASQTRSTTKAWKSSYIQKSMRQPKTSDGTEEEPKFHIIRMGSGRMAARTSDPSTRSLSRMILNMMMTTYSLPTATHTHTLSSKMSWIWSWRTQSNSSMCNERPLPRR